MQVSRLLKSAVLGLVVASPVAAQRGGTVELGGFGQYTIVDDAWHVKNGIGGGARLGVFLNSRWELEGTAAFSSFSNEAPRASGNSSNQTFGGQINYNLPFGMGGRTHQFLLEAGAGAQRFASHSDFSVPMGAGLRFSLSDVVALRFDGIVEYVENPTASTFGFPPVLGVNSQAARSTNVELRAGLSLLLGNRKPAPPPPAPVAQPRPTPPPPRVEPTPPPARIDTTPRVNTDSIEAVNRAREALLAKLLFDFDRSDLRDDQRGVLDAKIPVLQANPGVRIRIEGNADERGSDEYNLALGMRRAQTARKYLVDHGIDGGRIDIVSYGEERPVCQEHEESCWSQNRRDEFVIVAGGDRLVAPR
ncbi:MAG TPA: peptidoglycan-associated lipoprotein Pal [Gemmatimonadaceae bacterium]|jgi:peptidoglycan-associated lipoprotein|nr:peptidoglycan-associated lipoprotein Pal [Gemmatimonadaceae bacterium]